MAFALTQAAASDASPDTGHAVRKAAISREDLLAAALRLIDLVLIIGELRADDRDGGH